MKALKTNALLASLFILGMTSVTATHAERGGAGGFNGAGGFHGVDNNRNDFNNGFHNNINTYNRGYNYNYNNNYDHRVYDNNNDWAVPVINVGTPDDDYDVSTPCPTVQECDSDGQCSLQQNC